MADKARIGIIGTGWWATDAHMPAVLAHEDAELVAACDTDPVRLKAAAQAYGVERTYSDHSTHFPITQACLDRHLHVLLEKPMTLHAAEAKALVDLAQEKRRELLIGYPYHYLPQVLRAREVILSGELGAVQYVTCSSSTNVSDFLGGHVAPDNSPVPTYRVHGPSTAYNQAELLGGGEGHLQITHSAGLMFFVTGLRAQQVSAMMRNHGLDVDLVDVFNVAFEGGAVGMVGGTANAGVSRRVALAVYCEDGCFLVDTLARVAMIRRNDGAVEDLTQLPRLRSRYGVTDNFVNVVLGREENGSPGEVGWRTVELLDAAYRSAEENGAVVDVAELYA
jgi:predicted dehydrogenase